MPPSSFDPLQLLAERFTAAIAAAFLDRPEARDADPVITPARNPQFGDFQSNAAMALGKAMGRPPREIAGAIVARLDLGDLADPLTEASIAGPGFMNIRLRPEAVARLLTALDTPALGLEPPAPGAAETVVVDLCGVNLAKQMHVGHLRSTIVGDALARIFARLGHTVIRQNHVGDWGLPIAMVTATLREEVAAGRVDLDRLTLDELDRLYRLAKRRSDADERGLAMVRKHDLGPKAAAELEEQVAGANEAAARAKATLIKLQAHDPETVALWQRLADVTMEACLAACARLHADVTAADSAGESSYAEELAPLVADLVVRGVAEESDGALVVRVDGIDEPCLVRKSDGGFLYATTDLAAIRRRVQKFGASRVVYCVDARQALHFKQVFAAAHKAGYTARDTGGRAELGHAAFGMVLGEDGRPFKTRTGENVKLSDLMDEARERARVKVALTSPDLPADLLPRTAEVVGIAAIKYADLSNDRVRDYVFSFDRMIAFEGNTGPYLLYAVARVRSIFRKAAERFPEDAAAAPSTPFVLGVREEKDLALALLRYPGVVRAAAAHLEPHRLSGYLYDLATAYSGFHTNCPVLQAETPALRRARLRLGALTARTLTDGLGMLGITALERM